MGEFEFLQKQFWRLREAKQSKAAAQKRFAASKQGEKFDSESAMADSWELAIEYSIRDYLDMRATTQPEDAGHD